MRPGRNWRSETVPGTSGRAKRKTKAQAHDDQVRFATLCEVIWNVTGRRESLDAIRERALVVTAGAGAAAAPPRAAGPQHPGEGPLDGVPAWGGFEDHDLRRLGPEVGSAPAELQEMRGGQVLVERGARRPALHQHDPVGILRARGGARRAGTPPRRGSAPPAPGTPPSRPRPVPASPGRPPPRRAPTSRPPHLAADSGKRYPPGLDLRDLRRTQLGGDRGQRLA